MSPSLHYRSMSQYQDFVPCLRKLSFHMNQMVMMLISSYFLSRCENKIQCGTDDMSGTIQCPFTIGATWSKLQNQKWREGWNCGTDRQWKINVYSSLVSYGWTSARKHYSWWRGHLDHRYTCQAHTHTQPKASTMYKICTFEAPKCMIVVHIIGFRCRLVLRYA